MLESLLAPGGLVLLRGEGHRHRGLGAGPKGRKWRGRAVGKRPGVEVATGSRMRKPQCSQAVYPSLALPRLRGVGGAQPLEGAYQEICTVVSIPQRLAVLPEKGAWAPLFDTLPHLCLSGEQVHILGCEVSEEEFREGFDSNINSRLVYHDLFRDPLNWSKTGEALPGGPLEALRALCRRTDPVPVTIALDSLSWLLLHLPCTTLCQTLHALSRQDSCHGDSSPGEQVHVLGLLHEELHGPGPLGALSSLAQTEVTLSGVMGQASAHILYRRPQQRPTHQTQWFSILPDFSLELQGGPPLESQPNPDPRTPSVSKRARAGTRGCSLESGKRRTPRLI
uniref:Elongator complex protein 5 n=1 Tax=Balaenoptera musculus TaxID=9771 RepID=A0A8C0E2D2_BALMU